jgi:putative ABC transport system permease protein
MNRPSRLPPALAERLLAAVLTSPAQRDSVIGDLHEEFVARGHQSRHRGAAWFWCQSIRIAARISASAALNRLRRSSPPRPYTPSPGDSLMRTLGLETRHALRAVVKRPGLSGILVVTLALGLGANAAVFALIDALVLRPFTMPDVDRIVLLSHTRPDEIDRRETVSPADFIDWKKQSDVFERLAATEWWNANLVGRDEPEAVLGFRVSADFFPAIGVQPALGRAFLPGEETQGEHRRIILGHGLWQRRFAGDAAVIGRAVQIDGAQFEVVGIAPEGFDFPLGAQLWAPLAFTVETASNRGSRYLTVVGRLAPGRTIEDARAQMAVINERLETQHPDTNRGFNLRVHTLAQGMLDVGLGPILALWQASACFVLLIAGANVASLLLARGAERQREMAVRLAIGASRTRVVRGLLLETTIVAVAATPLAIGVSWVSLDLLRDMMPARLAPFVAGWQEIDVDGRLLGFTALLALATAVVFGLVPAFQATRPRLADSLKQGGRTSTAAGSRLWLRRGLVIAELALALPLLVTCGLSLASVHRFLNGPQGYNPEQLLTMQVVLAEAKYTDDGARRQYAERVVHELSNLPGVQVAAAVNSMPGGDSNSGRTIEIEGHPNPDPANPPRVDYRTATPSIFATLELPVLVGRGLTDQDREKTLPVAVVSQSLAKRYWPDADPLGRRLKLGNGPWVTVVGVCGDVIHNWFAGRNSPTVYRPMAQEPSGAMALLLRTSGDPSAVAADARRALRRVDDAQPVFDVMTMRARLMLRTLGLRYVAGIMTAFGGLALLLAVVGVYGLMAYMITQRTHEIGVRMALGATQRDVLRLSVGQTARLAAIGVALGIGLALALSRLIEAGLLGVAPNDLRIVAGFAAVLVTSALAAGYVPARRAATLNPIVALRAD